MKIVYTKNAYNDIQRLKEFITIKNPAAARKIVTKLVNSVDNLLVFPQLGKVVQASPDPDSLRDLYILDYHIRYLILKHSIQIVRIWHQKEDRN